MATDTSSPAPLPLERRALANDLITRLIRSRAQEPAFQQTVDVYSTDHTLTAIPLAKALERLARLVWLPHEGDATPEESAALAQLKADLAVAPPDIQLLVTDVMAHAGQLHQMAGILARESVMNLSANADKLNPVRRMLFNAPELGKGLKFRNLRDTLDAIAGPSFEMSFTGHPTNTNSIASMQAQRDLSNAVMALATGSKAERKKRYSTAMEAIHRFATIPLLPTKEQEGVPVPTPLTVSEEADTMLYFLQNLYTDLPATYQGFDKELHAVYPEQYDPRALKLNVRFHSWGSSGDKDGNANVNADTTLNAIANHKAEIFSRYAKDLETLGLPEFAKDTALLRTTGKRLGDLEGLMRDQLSPARGKGYFDAQDFDRYRRQLQELLKPLDLPALQARLENAYTTAPAEKKQAVLDLTRRMRTFGSNFGLIEYRETAEEYSRVIEALVPGYAALDESARCAALTELIQTPGKRTALVEALYAKVESAPGKPYSKTDPLPIAYHTLKRLELARDFPDAVQNNVLAECKNTSNILEALLLQHAVEKNGKRAVVGIVPLFEEHETLKAAPAIVRGALDNPAYQAHLAAVSDARGVPEAQQIQLAHSDNAKRAGVPAARALIAKAHEDLRAMVRDFSTQRGHPLKIEFFEGGSQSDAYRGGGRAISATVNAYTLHDFFKATFQGGDLLNFFNQQAASTRLFLHNIANAVSGALGDHRRRLSPLDNRIIHAMDQAKTSYLKLFNDPHYVDFLNAIKYPVTSSAGNFSSRAAARDGVKRLEKVDSTRAIGISETLQHAGLMATWVGIGDIERILSTTVPHANNPLKRKEMYEQSPVYRDIIDRMLYGLMRTDLPNVARLSQDAQGREHTLMPEFRAQYAEAFRLCMESYTGKPLKRFFNVNIDDPEALRKVIEAGAMRDVIKQEVYPHVKDVLSDQERYIDLARSMEQWGEPAAKDEASYKQLPLAEKAAEQTRVSLIHNMMDTVHHGRLPLVDDPQYAREYCAARGIARPWVHQEHTNGRHP